MRTGWVISAVLAFPLAAQPVDYAAIDKSALEELAKLKIPGASMAIVRGENVVYSKAFGLADVETDESVRPEMLFRLGSTTKMFTAAALVGLSIEGKIDLNTPIGKYIEFLPPKLSRITANQLLSHTAGIRDEAPMYGSHDDAALGSGIRAWTDAWLFTSPGKVISYSNPGYWLAGYLVETLSGMPYADAMEARLFQPLGMARTTLRPTMAMTWPLAQGHEVLAGKAKVARPAADNASGWPAGSIFSNTHDLSRFVIAFMNGGKLDGRQALDPGVIEQLSSPHAGIPGTSRSYGYGLTSGEFRGVHVVEHSGSRMGYGSEIRMVPAERLALIVQTNRTGATLPATTEKVMEMFVTLGPKPSKEQKIPLTLTAAEIQGTAGVYQNGEQRLEIAARDGHLFMKRGRGTEVELVKHADNSFGAGEAEFTTIAGADGQIEYVHSGLRSFVRVR